tara:strand:- start:1377 stop:1544 length:168 start_codon:yes stop_codon:yes gene_type:complete
MIENIVIGNPDKFTLALGKYAFIPSYKIPISYLEWILKQDISESDKEIISKSIEK